MACLWRVSWSFTSVVPLFCVDQRFLLVFPQYLLVFEEQSIFITCMHLKYTCSVIFHSSEISRKDFNNATTWYSSIENSFRLWNTLASVNLLTLPSVLFRIDGRRKTPPRTDHRRSRSRDRYDRYDSSSKEKDRHDDRRSSDGKKDSRSSTSSGGSKTIGGASSKVGSGVPHEAAAKIAELAALGR